MCIRDSLCVGVVAAVATLFFLLYSDWEFRYAAFILDPLLLGLLAGLISSRLPWLRRQLTRRSAQRERIQESAKRVFYEKGMSRTQDRIGLLVYVSLLERMVELVPDTGLFDRAPQGFWHDHNLTIGSTIRGRSSGLAVAAAVTALSADLAHAVPRALDDENEIADEVTFP